VGLATGFYPALQAGSQVLVNSKEGRRAGIVFQRNLRRAFVGSQFALSIALTICGIIVFRQAGFMKNYDTGYSTSNIMEFQIPRNSEGIYDTMSDWLDGNTGVVSYSFANTSPVNLTVLNTRQDYRWEGLEEDSHISIFQIITDEDFLNVFDISLLMGRFFSSSDAQQDRIVINKKLANMMDMTDPIGQVIQRGDAEYQIIGVVEDFNFQHLSNEIRPLLFMCNRNQSRLFVHYYAQDETVLEEVRDKISERSNNPLEASFISETRDRVYESESQMLTAILFFTVLCVLLSSLGLVGMVSHNSEERAKETAVRKVLGANSKRILISQIRNMFRMFIPATLFGGVLAWAIMNRWMENFAYRIGIEWWFFILGPAIILVSALLSIGFQTWKASRQPPAISLKHQ
jgi:ABC-type antimicrobial peptide transport system permease subunit